MGSILRDFPFCPYFTSIHETDTPMNIPFWYMYSMCSIGGRNADDETKQMDVKHTMFPNKWSEKETCSDTAVTVIALRVVTAPDAWKMHGRGLFEGAGKGSVQFPLYVS